mgnify:FL=1
MGIGNEGDIATRLKLVEFALKLLKIGKALVADGVQWGGGTEGVNASFTTITVGTSYEAFTVTIDPKIAGDLLELELGLTIGLLASALNTSGKWQWWGRPVGGTWAVICAEVVDTDIDTAEEEFTRQGLGLLSAIATVPFELKLMCQSDTAGTTITVRVKSSSYAIGVIKAT